MDSLNKLWKCCKNRNEPPTSASVSNPSDLRAQNTSKSMKSSNFIANLKSSDRTSAPMLNDVDVTVGYASQSAGVRRSQSFQTFANRPNSVSSVVQVLQTTPVNPNQDFPGIKVFEEARQLASNRSRSLTISRVEANQDSRRQQPTVNHPIPSDGIATSRLLVKLLKSGSEKLSFTPQAVELLKEYVWVLEMFPNHTLVGQSLKVNRFAKLMNPPPPPRINVFAQPALLALIKTDDQGNWLIDSSTLSCLLYFLYRQQCKPMLEEVDKGREELGRLRKARREHVEKHTFSEKFGSLDLK